MLRGEQARFRLRPIIVITALCQAIVIPVSADSTDRRAEIVVTATRTEQSGYDLPLAIDVLTRDDIQRGQLRINLSETLPQLPGVIAHNRQNYAQDLQVSVRGFGARSSFGVRGVRIYVDGIPATMPDGQGQLSHIELGSAERIEVLRGPFSALYGNSSGGVIAVFSEAAAPGDTAAADFAVGSYGARREAVKFSGAHNAVDYLADFANFSSDGYRDHSAVRRSNFNGRLGIALDADSQLKIIANVVDMPEAQDPLGLTRSQWKNDPRAAGINAEAMDTRKSVRQQQLGLNYRRTLDADNTLDATLYGGRRATVQYQGLLPSAQSLAASAGGVIDLERSYWGSDLHWTHRRDLLGAPLQLTAGLNFDNLDEQRRGYRNFIGNEVGVKGDLRRDEANRVYNIDQYAQLQWEPGEHWLLSAGVRNSRVRIDSNDHYIVPGNGDDSGAVTYRATTPVAGISWRVNDALRLYASYGRGFETPTLNELAYRSISGTDTGLNLGLDPSRSEHYEIGLKSRLDDGTRIELALFHIITSDELSVAQNSGGRSVYRNVGKTQRDGIELQFDRRWDNGIGVAAAYTWLRAKYVDDFSACSGTQCTLATVEAGNRLPAVPVDTLYGALSWRHDKSGFDTALEVRSESKLYVNDLNSDSTDGFTVLNWRAGFAQQLQRWHFEEFLRVDNLTDRRYAGSVIVNESNSRFFEPAPGRSAYLGVAIRTEF